MKAAPGAKEVAAKLRGETRALFGHRARSVAVGE
jgi:hypothetical protein